MKLSKQSRHAQILALIVACLAQRQVAGFEVATSQQRFHGIRKSISIRSTIYPRVISLNNQGEKKITALHSFRLFRRESGHSTPTSSEESKEETTLNQEDIENEELVRNEKDVLPVDREDLFRNEKDTVTVDSEELVREAIRQKSRNASGGRLRKLKDLVWVREALEDLTAAEFACSVESGANVGSDQVEKRRKRAVDYEKLLAKLNKRIRDLGCDFSSDPNRDTSFSCVLIDGVGSGVYVYTNEQRQSLLERLIKTRKNLIEVIQGYEIEIEDDDLHFELTLPELRVELPRETDDMNTTAGPKLYVREDGTVDWDGALQDQAALRKFGTAVWARINGREPETAGAGPANNGESSHGQKTAVIAQIAETTEIKEAREKLVDLEAELAKMEVQHTGLLNSAIGAGQAVANVNLATLDPDRRNQIIRSSESLEKGREKVSFQALLYNLERIYAYLAGELGNPAMKGYISLQDRLNIAEFGLLESQIESFKGEIEVGDSIDGDVLVVVGEQMNDFKRRLGIDYLVTGLTFDREAIFRWLAELLDKTKKTLAFYGKGCRLFWNDLVFTLSLITRAAQGYTLKPREVRTIR